MTAPPPVQGGGKVGFAVGLIVGLVIGAGQWLSGDGWFALIPVIVTPLLGSYFGDRFWKSGDWL